MAMGSLEGGWTSIAAESSRLRPAGGHGYNPGHNFMTIVPGARFGPYQIVSLIGAGGMGEVYKATDTRLQRTVAVKVLPDLFSKDEERLARFEREARTLASLNHPNIAQIYGLEDGQTDGRQSRALAMEFIDGEDLAERLSRGPMPVEDALAIARQVVDALEAAHEQGILHRDLKPANIKVRPDGTVKVLDFGLAKALDPPGASPGGIADTPTITNIHTHVGVLLGTAGYMAPEQAKGRMVDRRADIWAFGVLLYELLTGAAPFTAASTSEILARVIEREPDWSRVPATTPPSVLRLLQRCLQKDPRRRLQAIGDARFDIDEALSAPSSAVTAKPSVPRERLVRVLAVAGLASSAVLGVLLLRARAPEPHSVPLSAAIPLPEGRYLDGVGPPELALSKDGRTLAFLAREANGSQQLYVRPLSEAHATLVPGSETAEGPFFSPDGRWVAFAVGTSAGASGRPAARPELRKYSLDTRLTQPVAPIEDYFGGVWTKDDNLIFVGAQPRGLWKVPSGGGTPQNIVPKVRVDGEDVDRGLAWPDLLPGERSVLLSDWDTRQIAAVNLDTRELIDLRPRGRRSAVRSKRLRRVHARHRAARDCLQSIHGPCHWCARRAASGRSVWAQRCANLRVFWGRHPCLCNRLSPWEPARADADRPGDSAGKAGCPRSSAAPDRSWLHVVARRGPPGHQ